MKLDQLTALHEAVLLRRKRFVEIDRRVLTALIQRSADALSVRDVTEEISGRYRASVVKSSLDRLVERGQAVVARRKGRRYQAALPVSAAGGAASEPAHAGHE